MEQTLLSLIETAGGQSALARALGVSQQRVNYWVKHGKPIPAEFVAAAEHRFGIPRAKLRPDIFEAAE